MFKYCDEALVAKTVMTCENFHFMMQFKFTIANGALKMSLKISVKSLNFTALVSFIFPILLLHFFED